MGTSRINPAWRVLALGVATTLATVGTVGGLGVSVAHAAEQTYTHADGATVRYDDEATAGKKITVSGTGWLAKPEMVEEGEEGSVIGFKLIDGDLGQLSRQEVVDNPRLGEPISNATVWGAVWADGDGDFEIELDWPDAGNAVTDPGWAAGDTFTLQLLSGTLYSNQPGVDPSERPDVSRTVGLTITVVADEPTVPLAVSVQPELASVANGTQASFTAAVTGGRAPVTVQWQRSTSASATTAPANYTNLTTANTVDDSFAKPTLAVVAGQNTNANNRWYRAVFTDADGATVTTGAARLSIVAVPSITAHPAGQTVSVGGTALFRAEATSAVEASVTWQSTKTALANGEPDDSSWIDVPNADEATLTVAAADANAQHGTFYRAVFTNVSGSTSSYAAQLRFFEKLDTSAPLTVSGESYGPVQPNTPFSVSAPNAVVKGAPIVITGSGYLATDGTAGSVANFMIDASYSGDPNTLNTTREIINPVTGQVFSDKRSHGIVQANADGTWRIELPWPDETNTTRDAAFFATNWQAGTQHIVRILTGSLLTSPADYQRGISVRFTVVDEPGASSREITLSDAEVVQGDDLWFNLSGFEPGTAVSVDLVDGAGEAVASGAFTIGADGNTANPDGQTYRRVTAPRDVAPGTGYAVRVRDTASGDVLATSGSVTVVAATTRVYNPGDHAGGAEDLLVQRGGVWTFRAVAFAPNGRLTATAQVNGDTVVLGGVGQISASEKAWQLDAQGDTSHAGFTRIQIPSQVAPGEFAVTFSDGTRQVTRGLTIESPEQAGVTVAASAELGGTIRVTGEGFVHPNADEGSTVAIKINDGGYSRVDTSLHVNKTIWWIVEADEYGNFAIDMPVPNGTTADDAGAGTLGSTPALAPGGGFTLRFLTGSLKPGDLSRTLQSAPFTVTAPEPEPDPELTAGTPTVGGNAVVGATLTVSAGVWGPAPVRLVYQWLADGTPIPGATGTSYQVTAAYLGKQLSVRVTGTKDGYPSVTRESAKTDPVAAAPAPLALLHPSISGRPAVGSTLTATPGTWDTSGLTLAYQWLRNGAPISGATKPSYKVTSTDAGKTLSVRVTATKPGLRPGTATSAGVKAGKALTATPTPKLSGTTKVGKTLTAKAGTWKPSKVSLKYQWLRNGQPIAKATKTKYKLTKADAGHRISVAVTGSKSGYVSVTKTSAAKSVAKVKAKVKLSVPSKVAKGKQATAKITVTAAASRPTGTVKVTVNGKTVTATLTAAGKGKIAVKLPAIKKKGSYKVKASFSPTGTTAASASKSITVSKTLKVR
ncbi:MAG: Ig-like domain repeat protein [Propionicimonas sp.]